MTVRENTNRNVDDWCRRQMSLTNWRTMVSCILDSKECPADAQIATRGTSGVCETKLGDLGERLGGIMYLVSTNASETSRAALAPRDGVRSPSIAQRSCSEQLLVILTSLGTS